MTTVMLTLWPIYSVGRDNQHVLLWPLLQVALGIAHLNSVGFMSIRVWWGGFERLTL